MGMLYVIHDAFCYSINCCLVLVFFLSIPIPFIEFSCDVIVWYLTLNRVCNIKRKENFIEPNSVRHVQTVDYTNYWLTEPP